MAKRSRTEANLGGGSPLAPSSPPALSQAAVLSAPHQHPGHGLALDDGSITVATGHVEGSDLTSTQNVPMISRKVKACVACRKQKVRCCMDENGPPCRRCAEKDLSCVLNKSLQTLINERLPETDALVQDLEMVCNSVQHILKTLNLPDLGPLQSLRYIAHTPVSAEDAGPSCDNSPKLWPEDDRDLPRVPIQSIYHLTKLSALRSPENCDELRVDQPSTSAPPADFISQGQLSLEDAERLFHLYTLRLDDYMYGVGARYKSLTILRQKSSILTAAVLTVAAMHDPQSNSIYLVCNREFQRLMSASLFDRHVDRDHLRALCVASYWLNDAAWMLAGVASRRAATFNISSHFHRLQTESSEDSADFVRIWYLIYICDQHLSTLYGRQCETREDFAIQKWEALVKASTVTVGDQRLINGFSRQLDQWVGHWSTTFPEYQENFGAFPRKGALFHFHFAKLYLFSHVFRGLQASAVPPAFLEAAHGAASAAVSILNMIILDPDVRAALVGLPGYVQSMIGFACMFLGKLTTMHGDEMVERSLVIDLLSRLVTVYRMTPVAKWHLVHLMANGLERMLTMLQQPRPIGQVDPASSLAQAQPGSGVALSSEDMCQLDMSLANPYPYFIMDSRIGVGVTGPLYLGRDDLGYNEEQ
ncbi:hypothetical protein CDV36_009417 [Fusarium kuroshium]|uniref:Zn(2)-C6 fungal-type domain-containing protein n=1 Tax=Fusarium kuroshium TaxID=2010991 RepID=A0A3M2S023_9HYPO|nr:hypothetical protein CDV36_009417 [Fusarium kuroshium]